MSTASLQLLRWCFVHLSVIEWVRILLPLGLKAQRRKLRKVMHSGCMDYSAGVVNCRLGQSANYLQFTREWVKKVNCERLFCDFHVVFHYMETVLNLCLQSCHCLFLGHQLVFVLFIDICTAHTLLPLIKIWQGITLKSHYNNILEGNDATHVHTTNLHANNSCKINTCCKTWITVFQREAKVWFPLPHSCRQNIYMSKV